MSTASAGHGRPFYQANAFKKLQREWDDRLRTSGFRDLEYRAKDGGAGPVFSRNPDRWRSGNEGEQAVLEHDGPYRAEYYARAEAMAHDAAGSSGPGGLAAWAVLALILHAQGIGYRRIARLVRKRRDTVGELLSQASASIRS